MGFQCGCAGGGGNCEETSSTACGTIWRLFPSSKLTADLLLPTSARKMCHFIRLSPSRKGQPHRKPTCLITPTSTASQKAQSRKGQTHRKSTCTAVCVFTTPASKASQKAQSRRDKLAENKSWGVPSLSLWEPLQIVKGWGGPILVLFGSHSKS